MLVRARCIPMGSHGFPWVGPVAVEPLAHKVQLDQKALKARWVHRVLRVAMDWTAHRAQLVRLALKVCKEFKVQRALKDRKEPLALTAPQVRKDQPGHKGRRVFRDHKVQRVQTVRACLWAALRATY